MGCNVDVTEIEVTPEMIEAGADELSWFDPREDSSEQWVAAIFRAMIGANTSNT